MNVQQEMRRRLSTIALAAAILVSTISTGLPAAAQEQATLPVLTKIKEEPVTAGAIRKAYEWHTIRSQKAAKVNVNVIEVDLTNPHVKLDVMTGTHNQFTKNQTVLEMAVETKAVAGINGDFYNTKAEGVPIGPQIANGQLMATPPYLPGFYTFGLDGGNKPVIDRMVFEGAILAKDGTRYPLGGINKTYYWFEPTGEHSHINGLFMYTNAWGQVYRSNDGVTVPTEVLVQNGIIKQIELDGIIDSIAPADGYILRASGLAADFVRQHLKVGEPLQAMYEVKAEDPSKTYAVDKFRMMIGGHTILVDQGQPAAFSREVASLCCTRSRTAIGYSQDEKTVYLITADYSGESKGLTMTELQQLMVQLGVWKGINLDGGGSTQMVARPLGEFAPVLVNRTETGLQRKIVNAVGVFSTAPQGQIKGISIQAPSLLFIGERAALGLKAYDEYYNPAQIEPTSATWTVAGQMGSWKDNILTPSRAGTATITVKYGQAEHASELEIAGREQLARLTIAADKLALAEGGTYSLPVIATTISGKQREVPAELIQWEIKGIEGTMNAGKLTVQSLKDGQGAQLIANYDGYRTMTTIPVGIDKVWYNLDGHAVMTTSASKPENVHAAVYIEADERNNKYLRLDYDFTNGTGDKWAFAALDTGVLVEGEPQTLKLSVHGDESLNWLRAELVDNAGKTHRVDLARNINWKGWKQLSVDLAPYKMSYPIRVKSLYVVNEEIASDERAVKGSILIDDVTFTYRGTVPEPQTNQIELTVNKKSVQVNGKAMTLEEAPFIREGNTLLPIRFVTDALGGSVSWDDQERKVTIMRGSKMIELWIDRNDLVVNGQRVTAEVPPIIKSDLTMVPLRVLSENMGWKVTWDEKTQRITLQ
ncbi:stalk domain-containing protein [Paenibacillus sp. YYML68]|uniref:stalk domain-containing protein n=1 Tax=Paenibacillus sp. YYML68 TaxID=2909250 RepID=UPI00249244C1|nr:stalk domain-containing protein [Paenibacillus sp. YYML68]